MDTVLCLFTRAPHPKLFFCQGWVVVDVQQQQRGEWGRGDEIWGNFVEVCMQMAVVVRACVQQYATHCQCGALCVLTSTHTVDCSTTQYTH